MTWSFFWFAFLVVWLVMICLAVGRLVFVLFDGLEKFLAAENQKDDLE